MLTNDDPRGKILIIKVNNLNLVSFLCNKCRMVANFREIVQSQSMSEDPKAIDETANKTQNTGSSGAVLKLFALVAIVFALTEWGVPFMNSMVDKFRTDQEAKKTEIVQEAGDIESISRETNEGELSSTDLLAIEEEPIDPLKAALEKGITQWIRKEHPQATATVKYVNANQNNSRLAVEYIDSTMEDETDSKELIFTRDEFGIYIYMDGDDVRQIRVRVPK